jgi:hypothetical protein
MVYISVGNVFSEIQKYKCLVGGDWLCLRKAQS